MSAYLNAAFPTSLTRRVTGQYLARAHLSRQQYAELAAGLTDGSLAVFPLTVKQAAMLARVPLLDVTRARRAANGNGHDNPHNGETLAQHILRSSLAERAEAAREVGGDIVWDTMISPILTTDRAAK